MKPEPHDLHRDRDLGRLLDDSFKLYRRHFGTLLLVAAAVIVPVELAISGFGLGQLASGYDSTPDINVAIVQAGVALLVVTPLLSAMVVNLVLDVAKGAPRRRRRRSRPASSISRRCWGRSSSRRRGSSSASWR